jgi:hypothetical protein
MADLVDGRQDAEELVHCGVVARHRRRGGPRAAVGRLARAAAVAAADERPAAGAVAGAVVVLRPRGGAVRSRRAVAWRSGYKIIDMSTARICQLQQLHSGCWQATTTCAAHAAWALKASRLVAVRAAARQRMGAAVAGQAAVLPQQLTSFPSA